MVCWSRYTGCRWWSLLPRARKDAQCLSRSVFWPPRGRTKWRRHSCLPRRDSSRRMSLRQESVEMSRPGSLTTALTRWSLIQISLTMYSRHGSCLRHLWFSTLRRFGTCRTNAALQKHVACEELRKNPQKPAGRSGSRPGGSAPRVSGSMYRASATGHTGATKLDGETNCSRDEQLFDNPPEHYTPEHSRSSALSNWR